MYQGSFLCHTPLCNHAYPTETASISPVLPRSSVVARTGGGGVVGRTITCIGVGAEVTGREFVNVVDSSDCIASAGCERNASTAKVTIHASRNPMRVPVKSTWVAVSVVVASMGESSFKFLIVKKFYYILVLS